MLAVLDRGIPLEEPDMSCDCGGDAVLRPTIRGPGQTKYVCEECGAGVVGPDEPDAN